MASTVSAQELAPLDTSSPKTASAVLFKDESGNLHPLNPQQHKLSIVHFWATWCTPCVAELPEVDKAAEAYGGKGVRVVAISLDGDGHIDKVKKFLADHKITHLAPNLDFGNASFKASGLKGLPGTLFIDATGKEIARADGPLDWKNKETVEFIEKALR